MCQLAVDESSNWLMIDPWEALHKDYQPTAVVLDHIEHEINIVRQGVDCGNGSRKQVRIALLAGADLIHTMSTPGVWSDKDLDHILGRYGVGCIVEDNCSLDILLKLTPGFYRRAQWYRYRRGFGGITTMAR